jgi:FtsZ-binding cell division protein ZapB
MSEEIARVEREREKRLSAKDFLIIKKVNRNEKIQKAFTKLQNEHYELKTTERCLRGEAQANVHHTATLNSEIKVLCAETAAAKQRIKDLEDELTTNFPTQTCGSRLRCCVLSIILTMEARC